ncbi:aminotransferase class I/II-fold pyridoxal phosphate-dependent enzyme [Pseudoduganella sp. LjRoot289]|uniref:aminotransferase class I/II-fold pyridoxal phosphate-dependent enzyme n=1 Tax=Pseudoduganella sp. LjRoot289 TaxID=3342314 RepID=UPI003ECD6531
MAQTASTALPLPRTQLYDASGAPTPLPVDYPRARIPTKPVLSRSSFSGRGAHTPSILDAREVRLVTSGRVAIAMALRQMGVGAGDKVLVPSYHCASMIEPVVWLGATPVFYRINRDTSVNLDDVAAKIDGACKVMLATNYFGFPQNLSALRAFCDARGLMLLEDCAHSFLGEHQGQPVGSFGDYAIASTMKFFPIYEGGCLVSARHSLAPVALRSAGLRFEAKMAVNALEDGFEYQRLRTLRRLLALPLGLKNFLWGQIKRRRAGAASAMAPRSSEGGFGFDPGWLDKRGSLFSRLMLTLVSRTRMGALRRSHYQRLQAALAGLPGCRPLHPALPDGVYPWVFPLYVDDPEPLFNSLKNEGVPIVRFAEYLWQGVDATVCSASVELSRHVLQFPCHQELQEQELDWMITKIHTALLAQAAP